MTGIITPAAYALELVAAQSARLPVILWRNDVSAYVASASATGYPASSLGNPDTFDDAGWRGTSTSAHSIVMTLDGSETTDGFGIEAHNFGSDGMTLSFDGLPPGGDPDEPTDWVEVIADHVPAGDGTLMYRFDPDYLAAARLNITPVATVPKLAVLYAGTYLVMEKGVQPHTPIGWGARRTVQTGRSQGGDFMGRVITEASLQTSAVFKTLTPGWVRSSGWLDFAEAAAESPFFLAWDPQTYPAEVGYCWALNDLVAQTAHLAGFADITIEMQGVVS